MLQPIRSVPWDAPSSATFSHQAKLKPLPLPPLSLTLSKFIATVNPLLSPFLLAQTLKSVSDPNLQILYEELEIFARDKNSYIEPFWDAAYLDFDAPVCLNVNPVFVLEDDPTPARLQLLPRAVSLTYSTLKFVRAVRNQVLSPDKVKEIPLCMDQYKRLFGSARIPCPVGGEKDVVATSVDATHILIICQSQFYYMHVLTKETNDIVVTERELTKHFETIVVDASQNKHEAAQKAVGVLTSETRTTWRKLRKELAGVSHNNSKILEAIDGALFVVCLDVDFQPKSVAAAAANFLHGTLPENEDDVGTMTSRWYDKLMLIVSKGGRAGVNFEHSAVDGHTVLRYASDVFTDTIIRFAQTISGGIAGHLETSGSRAGSVVDKARTAPTTRIDSKPRKMEFDLNRNIENGIRFARSRLSDAILQNDTEVLEFTGYGKLFLVQNGVSPDATVQLAMQATFFDLYGYAANTYESVLTKSYFHGRTEAGRSCTTAAVDFMRAYSGVTEESYTLEEKINLLRTATVAHTKMTSECAKGMGVDRLIYAMECIHTMNHPGEKKPDIFSSPGWKRLNESEISTSNCGNPSLRFFGFGPVCQQGFGIGYIIKDDAIHFMITSKRRQTTQFRQTLETLLNRFHDDLIAVTPTEPPSKIQLLMFRSASMSFSTSMTNLALVGGGGGNSAQPDPMPEVEEEGGYDFFGLNSSSANVGRVLQ